MKKRNNQNGQVVVLAVVSILSLTMLWMMLINISKLVKDRIVMQNAADCAAQSAACIRARGLNQVGFLNLLMGGIIHIRPYLGWIPYLDCYTTYNIAKKISTVQGGIVKTYGGGLAYWAARNVACAQGADVIEFKPGTFSLGLKRNQHRVVFWSTMIIEGIPTPAAPITIQSIQPWYYFEDESVPHKNVITAHRFAKPQFFGKRIFNTSKIPAIMTIAAARPYNTKGPMFPEDDTRWGLKVVLTYLKSVKGWDAKLVPVGAPFEH